MGFGKHLRELRNQKEISMRNLAEKIGVNFTYISKIENETMGPPSEETLLKIATELGISSDDLILAANKIPTDIINIIINTPQLLELIRIIHGKEISEDKWDRLKNLIEEI